MTKTIKKCEHNGTFEHDVCPHCGKEVINFFNTKTKLNIVAECI